MARKKQGEQTTTGQANILKLAGTTTLREAIPLIRCGFEFEYHAMEGKRGTPDIDSHSLSDASYDAWNDLNDSEVLAMVQTGTLGLAEVSEHLDASNDSLSDIFRHNSTFRKKVDPTIVSAIQNTLMNLCDQWRSDWEDSESRNNPEAYYETDEDGNPMGTVIRWDDVRHIPMGLREKLHFGTDSSVRGGEIRTVGGLDIPTFLSLAKGISQNSWEVDEGCSFHIHLSVPEVRHSYGTRFQAEMYTYLLTQLRRMPLPLRDRLLSEDGAKQWARFTLTNADKYCAIHKHSQGTWEFRLFGNVTTYPQMLRCLELAVEALRHAYRVREGMTESLIQLPGIGIAELRNAFDEIYRRGDLKAYMQIIHAMQKRQLEVIERVAA